MSPAKTDSKTTPDAEPFKNWMGAGAAKKIALAISRAHPEFDIARFLKGIGSELEPLELKGRMHLLKQRLIAGLPKEPKDSFPILIAALKQSESDDVGVEGFITWPFTHFVADQGQDDFDLSMQALHRMTQVFTAEFAIRPFFLKQEERTLKQFEKWLSDPSEHVRRLVSEGSRPLLPWGEKLPGFIAAPEKTWRLLERLRNDPSEYVRKSVANHINDHSKNHGDWVIQKLKPWFTESAQDPNLRWIIRHATRTLVKKGHTGALALHGVKRGKIAVLSQKVLTPKISIGGKLRVSIQLRNDESKAAKIILDCEVGFLKANGKQSPKVFKGRTLNLKAGEKVALDIDLPMRKVSTRKYYKGKQGFAFLVNGLRQKSMGFELR